MKLTCLYAYKIMCMKCHEYTLCSTIIVVVEATNNIFNEITEYFKTSKTLQLCTCILNILFLFFFFQMVGVVVGFICI